MQNTRKRNSRAWTRAIYKCKDGFTTGGKPGTPKKSNVKCQGNTWLRSERVSVRLAVRIARFADQSLEHRGQWNLEPGLIPDEFLKNILVRKLSRLLSGRGLFRTTGDKFPDIFGNICERRLHRTYGPDVSIFRTGEVARFMYTTEHGTYRSQSTDPTGKNPSFLARRAIWESLQFWQIWLYFPPH